MKRRKPQERRCSYVVVLDRAIDSDDELRDLAGYLSSVGLCDSDVVVLDSAPRADFERHRRTLCWVSRHVAATDGDSLRAAADVAACEKVIVAMADVRYTPLAIEQLCQLLDQHEVVEPQDYLDPLPWWGGIEAGRILIHRGIEPSPDHGVTFGFRRATVRHLGTRGDAYPAADVFVRRKPQPLADWLVSRPRVAGEDFALPVKTAFFFALVPLLLLLTIVGDARLAGGYAGVIAFASFGLALRGRAGAAAFFPLRACLFAPLWVFERSVSVYWALWRKLRVDATPSPEPHAGEGRRAQRVS
jgi:hypothetical protein